MTSKTDELVPILRVGNAEKAVQWYARLGFVSEGVHRFEPGFPAYVFLRRQATHIHLSEHAGDAPHRGVVYWYVDRATLENFASEFGIAIERQPWCDEIYLTDPDGNRIRVGCRNDEEDRGFTATNVPG